MAEAPTNRGQVDRFVQYDLFGGRSRAASFCAGLEDIANLNGLRLRTPFDRWSAVPGAEHCFTFRGDGHEN